MANETLEARIEQNMESIVEAQIAELAPSLPIEFRAALKDHILKQQDLVSETVRMAQPILLEKLTPYIDQKINDSIGVLSLSEICDSRLMWAHYSGGATGFVVGFDSDNAFFHRKRSEIDEFGFLRKVTYQAQRPNVDFSNTSSMEWFQTKSEEWKYEREWRMVRPLVEASEHFDAVPFVVSLFAFPADSVAEVIYAPRTNQEVKRELSEAMSALPNAKLFKMSEQGQGYELIKQSMS
jgi:hypothetical protein